MRKMIVYGNCQAESLCNVLARAPGIAGVYEVVHHKLWLTGAALEANLRDFADADVLLVQEVRNWRTHPMRDNLPAGLRMLRIPFCYHAALWPFDSFVFGQDPEIIRANAGFLFQDGLLARLRADIPDKAERFARYHDLDLPDLPEVARYAELEEARLLRDDARLGMGIGRFIVERYRNQRLFHAITHLTPLVVERLAWEVLAKLGIDLSPEDVPTFHDYMAFYQVPLHPKVVAELGLTWTKPDAVYKFADGVHLTFEAYYRNYIAATA